MIESPSEESYSKKDSIYNEIIKENSKHNFDVVVLACGPLSKVLAYKLSKENICSYDIGLGLRYLWEGEDFSYKI
jgi:aspartate/glutamate racemase